MNDRKAPQYSPEFIRERKDVIASIGDAIASDAAPVIDGVIIDKANSALSEQAVSVFEPENGGDEVKIGLSVVDTSHIPALGVLERVAFERLETRYTKGGRVDGGRLFGDDVALHSELNFRLHRRTKHTVTPAVTFIIKATTGGLFVEGAENTFVRKQPQPVSREGAAADSTNSVVRRLGRLIPSLTQTADIEAALIRVSNAWSRRQLDKFSVLAFGDPAVFHRPMREWPSFKNMQSLHGVMGGYQFPMYTPEQVKLLDGITSGKIQDYDHTALEPMMALSSLLSLVRGDTNSLTRRQREEIYDILFDVRESTKRQLTFLRHAGSLAIENGLILVEDPSQVEVEELSRKLISLVQNSQSADERDQARNIILLGDLKRRVDLREAVADEEFRRMGAALGSYAARQISGKPRQKRRR